MRRVEEYFAQALAGPHADQETISRPHFYKDVRKTLQHLHHDHGCAKSSGCNRWEHGSPLVGKRVVNKLISIKKLIQGLFAVHSVDREETRGEK